MCIMLIKSIAVDDLEGLSWVCLTTDQCEESPEEEEGGGGGVDSVHGPLPCSAAHWLDLALSHLYSSGGPGQPSRGPVWKVSVFGEQ